MNSTLRRPRRSPALTRLGLASLAVVLAMVGGLNIRPEQQTYRAEVQRAVGLYVGSDVSILGVKVGEVTAVVPHGQTVEVQFRLPDDVRVSAATRAVLVAPTLVSDRRLELTPAYTSGPVLEPGATIPLERTAVPVEIDQVLGAVQDLSTTLGPAGANRNGALSDLVRSGARALRGNGDSLNRAVSALSQALATADAGGSDLAATLTNLSTITAAFAVADQPVRQLSSTLASVSRSLAAKRTDLVGAVDSLGTAMQEIQSLVRESGPAFSANVAGILDTTRTILKQEQALRETLNLAPVALQNFIGTFDPQTSTLNARVAINGTATTDPGLLLCQLVASNGLGAFCPALRAALAPAGSLLQNLPQPLGEGQEFGDLVPNPQKPRRP